MRLLPITIFLIALLLCVKIAEVVEGGARLADVVISPAVAEDKSPPKEEKQEKKAEEPKPAAEAGHGEAEEKKEEPSFLNLPKKRETPSNQLGGLRADDRRFSPVELELLQQLSSRREQLDKRESDLLVRENLLTQTEIRLDDKLAQMEALKTDLQQMLVKYDEQEDAKVKGLVKIYESMKPRDAATIFDELDMPVLLMVVDKMNEKRVAPILAGMNPKKAERVTVELAEMRRVQSEKLKAKQARAAKMQAQPAPAPTPAPVAAPAPPTPAAPAPAPAQSSISAPAATESAASSQPPEALKP